MLDKEVIQYTRNGVVKKNLATGNLRLVAESDYAKELKHNQPRQESHYLSPFDHPERRAPPKNSDSELNPFLERKGTNSQYHSFPENPGFDGPEEASHTWKSSFGHANTDRKTDPEKNRYPIRNMSNGGNTSSGTAAPGTSRRFSDLRHIHPKPRSGLQKSDPNFFFNFDFYALLGKR